MPKVARTVELKSRASSADAVAEWRLGAMRQSAAAGAEGNVRGE